MKFRALKHKREFKFDRPRPELLERFANPGVVEVTLTNKEFTSLCPITGQPDYGVVRIKYLPNKWCVESKSLKLYLGSYRNHGTFAETLAYTVARDLANLLQCFVSVEAHFASRGGIDINAAATCTHKTKF